MQSSFKNWPINITGFSWLIFDYNNEMPSVEVAWKYFFDLLFCFLGRWDSISKNEKWENIRRVFLYNFRKSIKKTPICSVCGNINIIRGMIANPGRHVG